MKSNAIARIVLYSLLILLLVGVLCVGLFADLFTIHGGSVTTTSTTSGETVSLNASEVSKIKIDWAAGDITIVTADTDTISFCESGEISEKYTMTYACKDGTLEIDYAKSSVTVGFGSIPSKDLTITVPQDWVCQELELDGAALEVEINGLTVREFDIDGASNEITFTGSFEILECDGAACELTLNCLEKPQKIDLDGASVEMTLCLPEDCGFLVQMDGLGCSFHSGAHSVNSSGNYMYGDEYCKVYADGLSCSITINHAPQTAEVN